VKKWALEHNLEVTDDLGRVDEFADGDTLGVVVAFGRIIPEELLAKMRMVNVHFSLLPRWRGAAPVERAILAGDERTGVCIMDVEKGLDTGAVHATDETVITDTDTTSLLTERLARMGAEVLLRVLQGDLADAVPQNGEATYAHKIEKSEYVIDWRASSVVIGRQVRALPALSVLNGKRLRVLECEVAEDHLVTEEHVARVTTEQPGHLDATGRVVCGTGSVILHRVQPEGRSAMSFRDWVNGSSLSFPVVLGL
jgi:methionyl-tRNA formyltransferase